MIKNPCANAGDVKDSGSIPGLERFPGKGNGDPLQYSCLENPMDRGAWRAIQSVRLNEWLTFSLSCEPEALQTKSQHIFNYIHLQGKKK